VYEIAESLYGPDHGGNADAALNLQLEDIANRIVGSTAEFSQQAAVEPEINPKSLRYREHPLAVWRYRQHLIFKPVGKQQRTLLVTRGAARSLTARKSDEELLTAIGASDSSEALFQVAALEKLVNRRPNDRPPKTILHPESFIVNALERINVVANNLEERRRRVVSVPIDLSGLDCGQGARHGLSSGGPNQRTKPSAVPRTLDLS